MSYVSLDDYVLSISSDELTDVLTQAATGYTLSETQVRQLMESKAESTIINFLGTKFNIDVELIKVGSTRNLQLVGVYIDLVLFSLFRSVSPDDIPEMRDTAGKDAIDMLIKWRDGDLSLKEVAFIADSVGKTEFSNPIKFISKPDSDPLITDQILEQIAAPTLLILDSVTSTQADLSWTSNSLNVESAFEIRRGIDNINFEPLVILPKGTIVYIDTTVTTGVTFYYKVKAQGTTELLDSDFSNVLTVPVP